MKRQLMGYGSTSDVYQWAGHTVVKLFKNHIEDQAVEYEALIHEIVFDKGVRMPKLLEEVQVDGRRGFIYEKLPGKSLLFHMMKKKWRIRHYSKVLALTQLDIHTHQAPLLPDLRQRLREHIHKVQTLTIEDAERLMAYINILPEGNTICHMNFHPGNVFENQSQGTTIDWVTATRSTAAADVARTYILLKHSDAIYHGPRWLNLIEAYWRHLLLKRYLNYYLKHSNITFEDVEIWLKPMAIARLSEAISEREKTILYNTYM